MQHDEAIRVFDRFPGLPNDVRRAFNRILDDHNIERMGRMELIVERDALRAELAAAKNRALIAEKQDGRSRHIVCLWKDYREAQSKALSAMTAERDQLAADNARLREALECVPVDLIHAIENGDTGANVFLSAGSCKLIGEALAATPPRLSALADGRNCTTDSTATPD